MLANVCGLLQHCTKIVAAYWELPEFVLRDAVLDNWHAAPFK